MEERRFLHHLTGGLYPIEEDHNAKREKHKNMSNDFIDFARYVSSEYQRLYRKGVYVEKLIGEGRRNEIGIVAGRIAKLPVEMLYDLGNLIIRKINNTDFVKKLKFTLDAGYWLIDRQISGESY